MSHEPSHTFCAHACVNLPSVGLLSLLENVSFIPGARPPPFLPMPLHPITTLGAHAPLLPTPASSHVNVNVNLADLVALVAQASGSSPTARGVAGCSNAVGALMAPTLPPVPTPTPTSCIDMDNRDGTTFDWGWCLAAVTGDGDGVDGDGVEAAFTPLPADAAALDFDELWPVVEDDDDNCEDDTGDNNDSDNQSPASSDAARSLPAGMVSGERAAAAPLISLDDLPPLLRPVADQLLPPPFACDAAPQMLQILALVPHHLTHGGGTCQRRRRGRRACTDSVLVRGDDGTTMVMSLSGYTVLNRRRANRLVYAQAQRRVST